MSSEVQREVPLNGGERLLNRQRIGRSISGIKRHPGILHELLDAGALMRIDKGTKSGAQKAEISGRVVEKTRERAARPIKQGRSRARYFARIELQPVKRRHHGGENADEENGHFFQWLKVEV